MGNRKKKDKKKALKHRFASDQPPVEHEEPLILFEPPGEVKMSEVLLDFIAPYDGTWKTEEQLQKLLLLAIVAWNAAISPADKAKELVESTMESLPPDAHEDYLSIIVELVERKRRFFAGIRRMIIDYKLTMLPDGPHLSVISTLGD